MHRPFPGLSAYRLTAALTAFGLAVLISYLSLVPAGEVPAPQISDKVKHFIAYASLAAPLAVALRPARWLAAVLIAAGLGLGLEVAQAMGDAGREGSPGDVLANLMGALAGAGLVRFTARRRS
ncbi:MAG: VanZ family protein [Hyphomonas sp.]